MMLAFYIFLTIVSVIWASNKLSREGFLIADRKLPSWVAAMSLVVSKFGGGRILAYGSLVYIFGWAAMWFNLGFLLGYALFFALAIRLKEFSDKHKFYTMTDYYVYAVGDKARWVTGGLCLFTMFGFTCLNIIGGAHILSKMSGFDYSVSVIFVSLFIGAYLLWGGFKAVIVTDVLQAGVILASLILFLFFAHMPRELGFEVEAFVLSLSKMPIVYTFFMGFMFAFGMPEVWPRIYAVREQKDIKATLVVTTVTYVLMGVLLAVLIMSFRAGVASIDMTPEQAILDGFQNLLPPYFEGVIAIFLFAAIMSSADTYLFQTNAALEQDLKAWDKVPGMRRGDLKVQRLSILLILSSALAVAFLLPSTVKALLFFASGDFILGILGLWSRFFSLSILKLYTAALFGIVGIIIGSFIFGIGVHLPLIAMCMSVLGILFVDTFVYVSRKFSVLPQKNLVGD